VAVDNTSTAVKLRFYDEPQAQMAVAVDTVGGTVGGTVGARCR